MRKQILVLAAAAVSLFPAVDTKGVKKPAQPTVDWRAQLDKDEKIVHALNRLAYGPRPGDIERVDKIGLKKWIDEQLRPSRIAESRDLDQKLAKLDTLGMETEEMIRQYPPPQLLRGIARGKVGEGLDPERKVVLERLIERYRERMDAAKDGDQPDSKRRPSRPELEADVAAKLSQGAPQEKIDYLTALPDSKLDEVLVAMPQNLRRQLVGVAPTELRRRMLYSAAPGQVIVHDLTEGKLLRAVHSNRQLEEVLVDFWYNHFNVHLDKGADRFLVTSYERDAIRPHVLGKFHEMLEATARHPAMLFYLDNWQSVDPKAFERTARRAPNARARGLNENYARELLELHTLGVDGGYTQKDVIEVARCFTGWTLRDPRRSSEFFFNERMHDNDEKTVLGVKIPAGGGINDGVRVLEILVKHPSTAKFLSYKLAQRFVADNPPDSLVTRMAATFRKTDGDIRAVMKTMLDSKEFWSEGAYRAKLKSPLEMVASAARALGADVQGAFALTNQLNTLGQPLYRKQEPTGYPNSGEEWRNSAGLLGRMNLALAMAQNKVPGVKVDTARFSGDSRSIAGQLLFREPSAGTLEAIKDGTAPSHVAGLIVGGPEFQRR